MEPSFEKILDLSFFITELLKWIGMQEIGRLKCTSKKIQSKLTIQNIRPLLEENLTFRTLIFRNHLEIIEQIIPFKFNKRKHKFPQSILETLFNKAANEGKLNLINLLLSNECYQIFGFFEVTSFAKIAAERGHIEIAKFVVEKFDFLIEIGVIDGAPYYIQGRRETLFKYLLAIANSRNDREFTKWLLKQTKGSLNHDRLELLEEIEKISKELQQQQQQHEIETRKEKQQWLDYLYYLSTSSRQETYPYGTIKRLLGDNGKKELGTLRNIGFSIYILPQKLIQTYCEVWAPILEPSQNLSDFFYLAWYTFIDDFEKFKETATRLELSRKIDWPLSSLLPDSPFFTVISRTIENKLPIKYFEFCLEACMKIETKRKIAIDCRLEMEKCWKISIQSKRLDIAEELLKLAYKLSAPTFSKMFSKVLAEDVTTLKWVVEQSKKYVDLKKQNFDNFLLRNYDSGKLLLDSGISISNSHNDLTQIPFFCDLDLCRLMFRHEPWRKSFDILPNWLCFIRFCLGHGDEECLKLLFSLQNVCPKILSFKLISSVFQEMNAKSKLTNIDVITDLMKTFET